MNYELFIAKRIAFTKKNGSVISRPIIRIALAGIALGFAVMIITVAIVTGFKKEIREKVIGFNSHIQVSNFDENNSYETVPVSRNQPFLNQLKSDPDVSHVQVFATKAGIIKSQDEIKGVVAKGIGTDFDWNFFRSRLTDGTIFNVNDTGKSDAVIISQNMADQLKLKPSDDLVMYFIQQPPRARKFKVSGIYRTGLEEFDNLYLFCDIAQIQKLNDWTNEQVGGFEISIKDFDKLDDMGEKIYSICGSNLNARTIREIYPQVFDWLGLQNINAVIIIVLMIVVAGINMISALLIIILERVNMIGTLKAIGARDFSIRKIFLSVAGILIGRGLLFGNIIGIGLCLLQKQFEFLHLNQESYYISYVPIHLNFFHILALNAGTLLVCVLMMIVPTILVNRISPLQALRFS